MTVLVAGGAGYIGSHTVVELLNCGEKVVIVDNLSNSYETVIDRIERITGHRSDFIKADVCDFEMMERVFSQYDFDAVIHFRGIKGGR